MSATSPYRARPAIVGFRSGQTKHGLLRNASASHVGSLEAILLDDAQQPHEHAMIAFDDLISVEIVRPSTFMAARIRYEVPRDRVAMAWLPLLYETSFLVDDPMLQDGSLTRFVPLGGAPAVPGVGLGHQDFELADERGGGRALIGIANIARIDFPLNVHEPDFEMRCARRGLDPEVIRKQFLAQVAAGNARVAN